MMSRPSSALVACFALLVACSGPDTQFQANPDDPAEKVNLGNAEVDPLELQFHDLEVGERQVLPVIVENVGETLVTIDYGRVVDGTPGVFTTDEDANDDVDLEPGESWELLVVAELAEPEDATGVFRVVTNDEDTPVVDVPLMAYPVE